MHVNCFTCISNMNILWHVHVTGFSSGQNIKEQVGEQPFSQVTFYLFVFSCDVLGGLGDRVLVFWGVFKKHGADCKGGSMEKRKEEVASVQHATMGACLASLGMEPSIASSNHRGLGGWSEVLSVVHPLSPVPSSVVHSCVFQRFSMMGMGFQMLFPVAQKLSRPKPTSKPSPIQVFCCVSVGYG
nr:hypothetical protein CFP56_37951 [Quercus suber]